MNDLYKYLPQLGSEEIILDVRGRDEFAEGHIQGALNIPFTEVGNHIDQLKKYKKIFIHCKAGRRAQVAAYELHSQGVTQVVCISEGGMPDWIEAGYPVHYAE